MSDSNLTHDLDNMPKITLTMFLLVLFVITIGVIAAVIVLPLMLPGLTRSLVGPDVKAYWYISRASAIIAYGLLWLSMVLGLLMTNKLARSWPGSLAAYDLHQFVSLLGLSFVIVHSLILIGDQYISVNLLQVLVPFATTKYRPEFVGLGQIGIYLWLMIIVSFTIRRRIGTRAWRLVHFVSFVSYFVALIHGITSGTDTTALWMQVFYWGSLGILLFLLVFRVLSRLLAPAARTKPTEV
jgi:predicted ferric reductase